MTTERLALLGGPPVCSEPWPPYNPIGEEEKKAVAEVLESGVLSQFRGTAGADFLGGPNVQALEEAWAGHFGTRYAVSFNSLTSGLQACIGAALVEPGDEVIVPPLTMVASATSVIFYGGVPVFADLDPESLCLDPESVRRQITPRTRAIVVVHLFGYPADMDALMEIAAEHDLVVIEDAAQAPAARYKGTYTGTIGDMGGFSLNYHKTIHSGEGGVIVTNDDDYAQRLRLIRNHGEACVEAMGVTELANTFGGNYRMTEIEAAIARCQLAKLEALTRPREELARYLDERLEDIEGLRPQRTVHPGDRHVYYFYPMFYDAEATGIPRSLFAEAVRAEGIELRDWYARPVYWEPMYRQKIAIGSGHFPFRSPYVDREVDYPEGLCPVAEQAYGERLLFGKFCRTPLTERHCDEVVGAIQKVLEGRDQLSEADAG